MKDVGRDLKYAMREIEAIIKKYNITGSVCLSDGFSHGEFKSFIELPTWSMISTKDKGNGEEDICLKAYIKSQKEELDRTVDAMFNMNGMLSQLLYTSNHICKVLDDNLDLDHGEGVFIPSKN